MKTPARLLACFALLLVAHNGYTAHAAAVPDGTWKVEVQPDAGNTLRGTNKAYPDTITIKDGKLTSEVNGKYGFSPGPCELKEEGGKTWIVATCTNKKHGDNKYTLEVKDGGLSGTMVWGKIGEDGKPKEAKYVIVSKNE